VLAPELYPVFVSRATETLMSAALERKPNGGQKKTTFRPSKDGERRSSSRVPRLLPFVSSGNYFARIRLKGKIICESEIRAFCVAAKATDAGTQGWLTTPRERGFR
jgi:hypothetical protein